MGNVWDVVDVHLDEVGGWVLLGEPGGSLAGLVTCGPGGALAAKTGPRYEMDRCAEKVSGAGGNLLDESWSNSLARTAPGSERIHDHDIVLLKGGVELSLAVRLLASELTSEQLLR